MSGFGRLSLVAFGLALCACTGKTPHNVAPEPGFLKDSSTVLTNDDVEEPTLPDDEGNTDVVEEFAAPACLDGERVPHEYCLAGGNGPIEVPDLTDVYSMRLGDVDGDGYDDLAVARRNPAHIQVYWGAPPSPFRYLMFDVPMPGATKPYLVELADLDGDNNLDLLISGTAYDMLAYKGDGRGVFEAFPSNTFPASYVFRTWRWVQVRDANGDGLTDLVGMRDSYEGSVRGYAIVCIRREDGTFNPPRAIAYGREVVFSDLDLDGDLDALIEDTEGESSLIAIHDSSDPQDPEFEIIPGPVGSSGGPALWGVGSRISSRILAGATDMLLDLTVNAISLEVEVAVLGTTDTLGVRPWRPLTLDADNDTVMDTLVSLTRPSRFALLMTREDMPAHHVYFSDAGPSRERVAVGDTDADGLPEAVFWSEMEQGLRVVDVDPVGIQDGVLGTLQSNVSADQIMAGDVDGDGLDDLVGVESGKPVRILFADGLGGVRTVKNISIHPVNATGLDVGDLNGDGRAEVVAVGTQRLAIISFNEEMEPLVETHLLAHGGYAVAIAANPDATGDEVADLYITDTKDGVHLYEGQEELGFVPVWSAYHGGDGASVRTVDFMGTGTAGCIVFGQYPKNLTTAFFNSDGVPDSNPTPVSITTRHVELGDVNGDGYIDIVGGHGGGHVVVAYTTADGSFRVVERDGDPKDEQSGVAVADFDGDGTAEIVAPELGELVVLKSTYAADLDFGTTPQVVQRLFKRGVQRRLIPAEINGDGTPDLWSVRSGRIVGAILSQP
ncbi:MAG: hypothetical protein CMH54_12185 [Myxococcales bacterium]|nr:hypothetical protein [Myxococcales bacterium]